MQVRALVDGWCQEKMRDAVHTIINQISPHRHSVVRAWPLCRPGGTLQQKEWATMNNEGDRLSD